MRAPSLFVVVVAALPSVGAWLVGTGVAPHSRGMALGALRASVPRAAENEKVEDEVTFSFGDAVGVSGGTAEAIESEERELTEREKEIAALRAAEKFMLKDTGDATCKTCSYKYKWEVGAAPQVPPKTPFELVPESFTCPNCKSPKAFFQPDQIEIAGFADNQAYGFGTNTWTEGQKSNAIFGGLAAFFLLFIGGYGLCAAACSPRAMSNPAAFSSPSSPSAGRVSNAHCSVGPSPRAQELMRMRSYGNHSGREGAAAGIRPREDIALPRRAAFGTSALRSWHAVLRIPFLIHSLCVGCVGLKRHRSMVRWLSGGGASRVVPRLHSRRTATLVFLAHTTHKARYPCCAAID